MIATLHACTLQGIEAVPVAVEADVSSGLPGYNVVGLASTSVKEGGVRIRAALESCGQTLPLRKITVNLAPADLRKPGSALDLPIALAVLLADGQLQSSWLASLIVLGELGLDGTLRAVPGGLAAALLARAMGFSGVLLPSASAQEAAVVDDIAVYAADHMSEIIAWLRGQASPRKQPWSPGPGQPKQYEDMADLRGQTMARAALEVAVAGGHNLLMVGPPGIGKTMLAKRVPSILPPMTLPECLETTTIYSALGLSTGLIEQRPFRAPHHTISSAALLGGGSQPRPGEVSLAHNGVLFLDELAEFARSTIEGLRQPLEDRRLTIARIGGTITLPASFLLVGAANPCPCGWLNSGVRECICGPVTIERYRARLSGPLLDRMDLRVTVKPVPLSQLRTTTAGECSERIRERVQVARDRQHHRLRALGAHTNAAMNHAALRQTCGLDDTAERALAKVVTSDMSARSVDRLLRVARTIADLAGHASIIDQDLFEAASYRAWGSSKPASHGYQPSRAAQQ